METSAAALELIGWREWLALPALGIAAIKAKVDTGARSSSLHVNALEEFLRDGHTWLRFSIASGRKSQRVETACEAPALDRRAVTDSSGHIAERWFIRTELVLAGQRWSTEINLTDRRTMLFPMLLGRSAIQSRFCVDPARSYVCGRLRKPLTS